MNNEFLQFLENLMNHDKAYTDSIITDNVKEYLNILQNTKLDKAIITDNGKIILQFLQKAERTSLWKSKDIANELGVSSRTVSGSLRKLVTDGFVEKVGINPIVYTLTEKGKNLKID